MRTTVTLDDEAYEIAVTLAKNSGKRLGQVISDLIRRAVQKPERPTRRPRQTLSDIRAPARRCHDLAQGNSARVGRVMKLFALDANVLLALA